jgi:hypothetical protein
MLEMPAGNYALRQGEQVSFAGSTLAGATNCTATVIFESSEPKWPKMQRSKHPKSTKSNTDFGAGSKLFHQEHPGSSIFNRLQADTA